MHLPIYELLNIASTPAPRQSMVRSVLGFFRLPTLGGKSLSLSVEIAAGTLVLAPLAYAVYKAAAPSYRVARLALGWRPPSKLDVSPSNVTNHGSKAESRFAGSVETYMSMAVGQVAVGHYSDNEFRVSGSGFRMDLGPVECLLVPGHVWEEVVMRAGDRVTLRGKSADVHLNDRDIQRQEIYTDVFLIQLPTNTFSKLGVGKPKIASLDKRSAAKLAGPTGMGTLGTLSLSERSFGVTHYEGTTLPGYSGAPYTVAGDIVAMHLRGADTQNGPNLGVSAQLLFVTAKKVLDLKLEDSEEWLVDQVNKRRKKMFIDQTWGHPDSMRVRIGNQFAIIEKDVIAAALGAEIDEYVDYIDFSEVNGSQESSQSGNLNAPGVLLSLASPQGLEQSSPLTSISIGLEDCLKSLTKLPTDQLKKIASESTRLWHKQSQESATTSGRTKKATT